VPQEGWRHGCEEAEEDVELHQAGTWGEGATKVEMQQ